ncbi:hypothetical protein ABID39_000901 [Bartonella japonica]|uniref:Uncharacterized protein n=1 Tax=Bartonella japonica TaxID=357761 RepID=A0ABV2FNS4_9HYPH
MATKSDFLYTIHFSYEFTAYCALKIFFYDNLSQVKSMDFIEKILLPSQMKEIIFVTDCGDILIELR